MAVVERENPASGRYLRHDAAMMVRHGRCCTRMRPTGCSSGQHAAARRATRTRTSCPYDSMATATEPIFLAVGNDRQFAILCRHLGAPALAADERFATAGARSVNRIVLKAELEALLAAHDGPKLADALVAAGVPCAPVLSVSAALQHPHTAHRGMVVEMAGGYRGIASPIKLSRLPGPACSRACWRPSAMKRPMPGHLP